MRTRPLGSGEDEGGAGERQDRTLATFESDDVRRAERERLLDEEAGSGRGDEEEERRGEGDAVEKGRRALRTVASSSADKVMAVDVEACRSVQIACV